MPLMTALAVAEPMLLNPSTQGEMIIQIPNKALIPDSQFICAITSDSSVAPQARAVLCAR